MYFPVYYSLFFEKYLLRVRVVVNNILSIRFSLIMALVQWWS